MLMVFFSKKKVDEVGEEATKKTKARFAINIDEGKAMRTKKIIQAVEDITEVIGIHKDLLYYHVNEFYTLTDTARNFAEKYNLGSLKKDHSF